MKSRRHLFQLRVIDKDPPDTARGSARTMSNDIMQKTCCGGKMVYQDIFGVRRYQCYYRDHHPVLYVNLTTGEMLVDEDGYGPRTIPFHEQES